MEKVKVLGVVGSPRKNGNTAKLVKRALEGAKSVPGIETEFYEMAGKKFHHCTGCLNCAKTGACVFKDDFPDFLVRIRESYLHSPTKGHQQQLPNIGLLLCRPGIVHDHRDQERA